MSELVETIKSYSLVSGLLVGVPIATIVLTYTLYRHMNNKLEEIQRQKRREEYLNAHDSRRD